MGRPEFHRPLYIDLETPEEVDTLWANVKDHVDVIYEVDDFDYGAHEFGICDDSGNSLAFGAPSKTTPRHDKVVGKKKARSELTDQARTAG
jgi:hypothetical protein